MENYSPDRKIHGIIANPICTEFSTAMGLHKTNDNPNLSILEHCQRIIKESNPVWWVIENPATGTIKNYLNASKSIYQPWQYNSPWTKKTALWGVFTMPPAIYSNWDDVPKNEHLYIRPGRKKPSLAFLHKSAIKHIKEFEPFIDTIDSDNAFRSLCSQGFANEFKKYNP